jgi:hypothetical protein
LREHTLRLAERPEAQLAEERPCFIDSCPADWVKLSIPEGRIVVGLDGGYPGLANDIAPAIRSTQRPENTPHIVTFSSVVQR